MDKKDFTIQLTKDSVELLIEKLSKESDDLYAKQLLTIGEEKTKVLERFMIVQDLLSQFELLKMRNWE